MKTKQELQEHCKLYIENINLSKCNIWEEKLVKCCREDNYQFGNYLNIFYNPITEENFSFQTIEELLSTGANLPHILPKDFSELLEAHLRQLKDLSHTKGIYRIDVRGDLDLMEIASDISDIMRTFFATAAYGLTTDELIRGQYPDVTNYFFSFTPVLTAAIQQGKPETIEAAKEVLTSENNVGILTKSLITAIESNSNEELHMLLLNVLRAAKLQEGLRQSIVECGNEYSLTFYKRMLKVIAEEGLLRYSSVRRSVQTWAGIGYEAVTDKDIKTIFEGICLFMGHPEERAKAYMGPNALLVYIALYTTGAEDFNVAQHDAIQLINNEAPLQNRIAAIYYLDRSSHFKVTDHFEFFAKHLDDPFTKAFFIQQLSCTAREEKYEYGKVDRVSGKQRELFQQLFDEIAKWEKEVKNNTDFTFQGFEWFRIRLSHETFINALWVFASQLKTQECIDHILLEKMPNWSVSFTRYYRYGQDDERKEPLRAFMQDYYPLGSPEARRQYLTKNIFSYEKEGFEFLLTFFPKEDFTVADIKEIEKKLKSKVSDTRNKAVRILLTLPYSLLKASYERLQTTKGDYIPAALTELREGNKQLAKDFAPTSVETSTVTPTSYPGPEGGYGLYKTGEIPTIKLSDPFLTKNDSQSFLGKVFNKITGKSHADASSVFTYTIDELHKLYTELEKIIVENADKEYKSRWGGTQILGDSYLSFTSDEQTLDTLPYPELWKGFLADHPLKDEDLLGIYLMLIVFEGNYHTEIVDLNADNYPFKGLKNVESWKYDYHFKLIIATLLADLNRRNPSLLFRQAYATLALIYFYCPTNKYIRISSYDSEKEGYIFNSHFFSIAMRYAESSWRTEEEFKLFAETTLAMYEKYAPLARTDKSTYYSDYSIDALLLSRYNLQGHLSDDAFMELLLQDEGKQLQEAGNYIYNTRGHRLSLQYEDEKIFDARYGKETYENLQRVINKIAQHLFKIEMTRLNAPTTASYIITRAGNAMVLQGAEYMVTAMKALGKDHLMASSYGTEKRVVLTDIIELTFPLTTDKSEILKPIKDDRLLELAYFAPQWVPLIKAHLNWEGFDLAYYYFIAHTKEMGADEKRAATALFTDLDPADLADGAFDEKLFHEAYTVVGEKRFELFYKAARYIGSSNYHSRARRFADTALGKIDEETITEQIHSKRNKDAVCSLGLLPDKSDKALQRRYQLIQAFLKESKQYGAQRQASEKRVCEIALLNLSRGAGYADPMQLTWRMESQQVTDNAAYLQGINVEGYTLRLQLAEDGTNKLIIQQGEKVLKTVPTKIKKHPDYLSIADMGREWTKQRKRARTMLEDMMIRQTPLRPKDVEVIAQNPIVSPMFRLLLLRQGTTTGFLTDKGLETLDGVRKVKANEPLAIAHAQQLYADGTWSAWQHAVFNKKIVQPFKQIFREIYIPTPAEAEQSESLRYSGYQIQVKQAAAALRSRGWSADYEGGLRKVFYRQGISVELYAKANWFTPADVEAPAIEYVSFSSTRSDKQLKIADIDPILYSEVMRDVDMTVSIAFVGGVDPETGNSTKELRAAIVKCTAELMKFNNVTVSDNFIHVKGSLADYTIHLGSGNVRQVGGVEIPIIPVHGQHRGKLYLPFMDEDPKTVEIVSKMVLLAEDNKLKDPTILKWIKRE